MPKLFIALPDEMKYYFEREVWENGSNQIHDVVCICATDATHIYAQVEDKVLYTVSIDITSQQLILGCNCSHYDHCTHEAAALCYLKEHPYAAIIKEPLSMTLSKKDEFTLYLKKLEEEFELYSKGAVLNGLRFIQNLKIGMYEKIEMNYQLMDSFYTISQIWNYFEECYQVNSQRFVHFHTKIVSMNHNYLYSFISLSKYVSQENVYFKLFTDLLNHLEDQEKKLIQSYMRKNRNCEKYIEEKGI